MHIWYIGIHSVRPDHFIDCVEGLLVEKEVREYCFKVYLVSDNPYPPNHS